MSDFLTASLMRSSIESSIARGARKTADASHHAARRVDAMSDKISTGIAHMRTDMLEGMDGVRGGIEAMSTQVGQGLYALNLQARHTHDELKSMGMTLSTISSNVVTGFNLVLNRLESVQGTLEEIKAGVLNPEETKGLERYRTARLLAEKGRPVDALRYVDAAIENSGGLPLEHIPELRTLRGMLYMGLHDTDEQSVIDPQKAVIELKEALVFARPVAKPMLQDHLGMTLFGIGDYQGALKIYEDLSKQGGYEKLSTFQKGRCYLSMSMTDHARDVFKDLTRKDMSMSLVCASDPVCSEHPEMFSDLFRGYREAAISEVQDAQSQLPDAGALMNHRNTLVDTVNTLLDILGRSHKGMKEEPAYIALERLCAAQPDVSFNIKLEVGRSDSFVINKPLKVLEGLCRQFDEIVAQGDLSGYDVAVPNAGSPWSVVARYVRAMQLTIEEQLKAYKVFEDMVRMTTDMFQGTGDFADTVARRPLMRINTNIDLAPGVEARISKPKKPGIFAGMTAEGKRELEAYYAYQDDPREYAWQAGLKITRAAEEATNAASDTLEDLIRTRMKARLEALKPDLEDMRTFVSTGIHDLNELEFKLSCFETNYAFCLKEIADTPDEDMSLSM